MRVKIESKAFRSSTMEAALRKAAPFMLRLGKRGISVTGTSYGPKDVVVWVKYYTRAKHVR